MGVIVRQKVKGKGEPWWVFITHDGKRTSRRVGARAAAEAVAREISAQLQLGEFDFQPRQPAPTFKAYAEAWFNTTVKATCKPSTVGDYEGLLNNHLYPAFEKTPITDINRGKVKEFLLSKLNEGFSPSTVSHMKNVLSGVLAQALDHEVIQANTALGIKKIANGGKAKQEAINPLTGDELDLLLQTVYHSKKHRDHFCLFLLLARTGMRIGEALALQWGDIDFNSRFIEVKRSVVRGIISTPKSGKTRRVDMSPQLTEALLALEAQSKRKGLALGLGDLPEFVFTNENGNMLDKDNWRRRVFNKVLKEAKLRTIRPHDLRHTYATLRISKGDNIADVSGQLGHHSVKLTLDVYFHWMPGKRKSEVDGLDSSIFSHLNAPQVRPVPSENKKGAADLG
jgi:integrase